MSETSRIFSVQPDSVSGIKTFDEMEQDKGNMVSKKAGLQNICKNSSELLNFPGSGEFFRVENILKPKRSKISPKF